MSRNSAAGREHDFAICSAQPRGALFFASACSLFRIIFRSELANYPPRNNKYVMTTPNSSLLRIGDAATAIGHNPHCEQNQQELVRKRRFIDQGTQSEDAEPSTNKPKANFGFSVNGFHPQWSGSSNILFAARSSNRMTDQHRPVPVMPLSDIVGTKVNELICRLRHDEEEKKKKRKQDLSAEAKRRGDRKRRAQSEAGAAQTTPASKVLEDSTFSYSESTGKQNRSDFSSLYGDIFLKSNVAQLIVSPGGRILACEFYISCRCRTFHLSELASICLFSRTEILRACPLLLYPQITYNRE